MNTSLLKKPKMKPNAHDVTHPQKTPHKKNNQINVRSTDSTRTPIHVHEIFLNCCRKEYASVEIVTQSGEIIDGVIDGYDKDTIVVHNDMTQLLIYKHSINYISPRNGKRLVIPEGEMCQVPDEETIIVE
ncbi:MAG: RNA chaperone Hfq [Clostridiales bacterium]|nr:RNA chaperone Hfq [Clostridiales bacterium]